MSDTMIDVELNGRRLRVAGGRSDIAAFWRSAEQGRWEDETFRFIDAVATPDAVLIDIGGWIGPVSLYAAPLVKRVLAFEPDPVAHAELLANASANAANVEVWNAAVDAQPGELKLYAPAGLGSSETSSIGEGEPIIVRALTVAAIADKLQPTDPVILKVDIEGHEYRIVDHLIGLARDRRAPVHLSLHPRALWRERRSHQGPIAARMDAYRATLQAIESLGTVGPVVLSNNQEPVTPWQVFRRVVLKRRPKNFSVEVRAPV